MTTTRPARVIITFSGLKSRCTSPAPWIASSPARNCAAMSRASTSGERAARPQGFAERRAVDVFHRQQLLSALVDQIEDAAHVRREHLSGGTDLASQQVAGALVPRVAGTHRLQRHVHPQLQIEGAVAPRPCRRGRATRESGIGYREVVRERRRTASARRPRRASVGSRSARLSRHWGQRPSTASETLPDPHCGHRAGIIVSPTQVEGRIARGRLLAAPAPWRQDSQQVPHLVVHIVGVGNRLGDLLPKRGPEPLTQPMDGASSRPTPSARGPQPLRGTASSARHPSGNGFSRSNSRPRPAAACSVRSRASTRSSSVSAQRRSKRSSGVSRSTGSSR